MASNHFYTLEESEKAAIFQAIASEKGMTPFAVEKDWWVSRTLNIIFNMDIAKHLVFKGGTSLSKAWKLINRFSEDIDLAIDREFFFASEKNWSKKKITKLRKESGIYITGAFVDELKAAFQSEGFTGLRFEVTEAKDSDQDPRTIAMYYPNIMASSSSYIAPRVHIEIGSRSLREPFTLQTIGSLVDEVYGNKEFANPLFTVPAVNPERTFLEKLFLLHEEFHRPPEKSRVNRLSRHLYDIHRLTQAGIAHQAIHNKVLYETIVKHRHTFSRVGGVDYNGLNPKTLNPVPTPEVIDAWKKDYATMLEEMIYELEKPTFDDLIDTLHDLMTNLQSLDWAFEPVFKQRGQTGAKRS